MAPGTAPAQTYATLDTARVQGYRKLLPTFIDHFAMSQALNLHTCATSFGWSSWAMHQPPVNIKKNVAPQTRELRYIHHDPYVKERRFDRDWIAFLNFLLHKRFGESRRVSGHFD